MINALTTRAPPVGRRSTILGGGIFDWNYGEFSTGVDKCALKYVFHRRDRRPGCSMVIASSPPPDGWSCQYCLPAGIEN
jgi:hypothetical protein